MTGRTTRPIDPEAVASALDALPGVRLHPGAAAATHLPGRRVGGVRLTDRGPAVDAEVHVTVVFPTTVTEAAEAVRAALAPLGLGRVDVVVADVVRPEDLDADDDPPGPARPPETGGSHG